MRKYYYLIFLILLTACSPDVPELNMHITQCADCPEAIASARAFSLHGKGYIFGGRKQDGSNTGNIYVYDAEHDTWETISTPIHKRVNASVAVYDSLAYIGLGYNGTLHDTTSYLQDWWAYNPVNNQWKQLASLPVRATDAAVNWALNGKIYVAHPFCDHYIRDVWEYDIQTDKWQKLEDGLSITDYPERTFGAAGAVCNGRCFIGTGHFKHSSNQWSEYLPEQHRWIKLTPVPGIGRVCATATATDDKVFLIGGWHFGGSLTTGKLIDDILCYDPETDTWSSAGKMPDGGSENRISFTINNVVYFGLGENSEGTLKHLYRIDQ